MEKQETRLIGVAHCIVPKEELIEPTIQITTHPSTTIANILMEENPSNISLSDVDSHPNTTNTTDALIISSTSPTETTIPPMTVAEIIIRRNETESTKSINIENDSLPLTLNITETNDNFTIIDGNDIDDVGIENDLLQAMINITNAGDSLETMPDNDDIILSLDEYIITTTKIPEMSSVNSTSTSENSTSVLVTVPVPSTTLTPSTIKSTTITELLLDKIEEISVEPEQENYVYEVMTLPQVVRPTDERAQNIVLEETPPISPNDTAIAA